MASIFSESENSMLNGDFAQIIERQLATVSTNLLAKGNDQASKDPLHKFKQAAALGGTSVHQAIGGMMSQHTVAIYDMCNSEYAFTREVWEKEIVSHLEYLVLLGAAIIEEDFNESITTHVHDPNMIEQNRVAFMEEAYSEDNQITKTPDMAQTAVFPRYNGEEG